MAATWQPDLPDDGRTLHDRILDALRRDIATGRLAPDTRMPTQRALAEALSIGVGTVTRAYAEAERLGWLTSTVGRGTFVSGPATKSAQPETAGNAIDLGMNLPALGPSAERIADALARLRRRPDIGDYTLFAPHPGFDWHRQAAADWLAHVVKFDGIDWRRLLVCTGAQQAMALAFDDACRPGDTIMVEAATFHGARAIADYRGYRLMGLPMDRDGLLPEALDRAAAESGSRVVYLQPTLQNPTARTMPAARREAIAAVARQRDLLVVEGDVYGPLAWVNADIDRGLRDARPLATLIPERTYYVNSVSKALSPGLRCGFLVAPKDRFDRVAAAMRAVCYSTCTLGPLVAAQWIKDGTADDILHEVTAEAANRAALALRVLGDAVERPSFPTSLHVWMPLSELDAERTAGRALRRGVALTPPAALIVAGEHVCGLRLCLSAPRDMASLERGLRGVAAAMTAAGDDSPQSVV